MLLRPRTGRRARAVSRAGAHASAATTARDARCSKTRTASGSSFAEAFPSRPTALAFFYTRCTNPDKCSLTVTRLARLAQRVAADKLDANVAGISYDPGWDNPGRLRRYGSDRGMRFSPRCTLLRTVGAFDPLIEAFELGVGFGPVTVNRHRLDLVVLDRELGVVQHFERRLWSEETVHDVLRGLATREPAQPSAVA